MTKIWIIANIADFFLEFFDAIIDVDSFACFDAITLEKNGDVIASQKKRHQLRHTNLKIAHKNGIFSKQDFTEILYLIITHF